MHHSSLDVAYAISGINKENKHARALHIQEIQQTGAIVAWKYNGRLYGLSALY